MDANEYAVVDGAPLRILFLALDAKLVQVLFHLSTILLGEIAFSTPKRFGSFRSFFLHECDLNMPLYGFLATFFLR